MQRGARRKLQRYSQSTSSGSRIRGLHAPFTGSEIISILSLPQGPEVGEVLQLLENMFIETVQLVTKKHLIS
ncbi:MAG: hypothetical protein CM15mP49_23960 [Actinomycetota bacterium]|nr:MAG: hypothetical protein CM15mP49_23960 [Actinomycetota bacterium]